jgi:maleate isomerase
MSYIPYSLIPEDALPIPLGLIVLRADETLEPEFHEAFASDPVALYVSRIPSAPNVTPGTLRAMEADIVASADLLPKSLTYAVVGYGCTSASAIIGSKAVASRVKSACNTKKVTNPLRAAIAFAKHHGLSKLALLSPYVDEVNVPLRAAFSEADLSTDVFGTFGEGEEAKVARIDETSIMDAAISLGSSADADGLFLSCTNLKTLKVLPKIQKRLGKPVFSSNSALSWHMKNYANI